KDWRAAKADLAKWRSELKKDLDAQTMAFKTSLTDMLKPPADKKKSPDKQKAPADAPKAPADAAPADAPKAFFDTLSAEQKAKGPLVEPLPRPIDWRSHLDLADNAVKYGLVAVGVGLIAGCFTRLAALVG